MVLAVITIIADNPLIVASSGAVFSEHRAQPVQRYRTRQTYFITPVAAAVAGQKFVLVTAYR
ncbi:hypothetical protein GS393_01191 [Pseudomonas savastanoi pv. phaseolicola]|nr:hypothetical protein [Pseudomonas savastanoi pv. phaseolicola]